MLEYITGMDTRLGYPNEHLAKSAEETKSPIYATGVGLVIKGFQDLDKHRKSGQKNTSEPRVQHKGSWFSGIFDSTKKIFTDDSDDKII